MINPSLTISNFKLFHRDSKRFKGINYNSFLPTNTFICFSWTNFYLSTCHIDLITRYLKRKLKKSGTLVFPSHKTYPITKKPTEVRMGKGKGAIVDWTIPTKKGSMPFLFHGKKTLVVKTALQDILKKLPLRCKIINSKHIYTQATSSSFNIKISRVLIKSSLIKKDFFQN